MSSLQRLMEPILQLLTFPNACRATSLLADATAPYIIAADELTIKQRIGGGCSGSVHLGKWQETDVAIKVGEIIQPSVFKQSFNSAFTENISSN